MQANADTVTLLDDAIDPTLTARSCDLAAWFSHAGKRFAAAPHGHRHAIVPPWMREPTTIRAALFKEFSFRARTEESATRKLGSLVRFAPSLETMDFYATQLLDEARHAFVFRRHLIDCGADATTLEHDIATWCAEDIKGILKPLEEFSEVLERDSDFIGGVILLAIIAEGALAPAAELSALKWRAIDPRAAEVAAGANWDEVRHLAVGCNLVQQHLASHPSEKSRLEDIIRAGLDLWKKLPIAELLLAREQLFQAGMQELREELRDAMLLPDRPLLDTTAEERLLLQYEWSQTMRAQRLDFMGLRI